ncbi:6-phospho-3-hexuloisomerase [Dyadobacter flavalbus]|uniref:6-phospho-3-hexuloisomerase n=1 Tax=Dyadobacter flavalbus TaxID=2579942 RepID=A0A5M8QNL0_9BACT|nr:6-phospho-3-hexuloisomerase [Dyadobacter flavalbus]KAA6436811.1 6-phospho-3-hexuloisomerase [Dyadobacter flavalbus]
MHLDHQQGVLHSTDIQGNLKQILAENYALSEALDYQDFGALIKGIQQAKSIFLHAAGRSGYSMRSVAMRLMHLGFKVYFVGDTTTPAIQSKDLLWVASGSGTTGSIVRAAEKAKSVGANVIAMTTNPASTLAGISDTHILLPAAEKEDHAGNKSKQYAGSLFEQALLLIGDAIFMELWKVGGCPAETLWKRHANME